MKEDGPFSNSNTPTRRAVDMMLVQTPPESAFALLDGGLFDDLSAWLKHTHLRANPLFRESDDPEVLESGPWLVPLDDPQQITALAEMMEEQRPPVLLSWRGDADGLYAHLRRNTRAEIPDEQMWPQGDMVVYETVLFRFWDPAVLHSAWAVLRPDQQRRLLPGASFALVDAWGSGALEWLVPSPEPAPPGTPHEHPFMRFSILQSDAMGDALNAPYIEAMTEHVSTLILESGGQPPPRNRIKDAVADADWDAGDMELTEQGSVVTLALFRLIYGRDGPETQALIGSLSDPKGRGSPDQRFINHVAAVVRNDPTGK